MWNQAHAATEAAQADHARAQTQAQQQAAAHTPPGAPMPAAEVLLGDPGEAQRAAARGMLARARAQLVTAGETAADAVAAARDQAPQNPSLGQQAGRVAGEVGQGLLDAGGIWSTAWLPRSAPSPTILPMWSAPPRVSR